MNSKLVRIGLEEAELLWKMQVEAFQGLYAKYQDTETSPATEKIDKIIMRLKQPFTYYYFIVIDDVKVGAVRVVDKKYTVNQIGNLILFCKKRAIAIFMKKWGITRQERQNPLMIS